MAKNIHLLTILTVYVIKYVEVRLRYMVGVRHLYFNSRIAEWADFTDFLPVWLNPELGRDKFFCDTLVFQAVDVLYKFINQWTLYVCGGSGFIWNIFYITKKCHCIYLLDWKL